jgi:hypothetical protein
LIGGASRTHPTGLFGKNAVRKPLRLVLWIGGALLLLVAAALFVGYRAAGRVPEWYQRAADTVEPARQRKASDEMERRVTDLASGVESTGKWKVLFTAEQVNGWLAVALKEKHSDLLPPDLTDPRVAIEPDGITIGGRFRRASIDSVVSLKVDVFLAEPNVIAARIRNARAGALPWPLGRVLDVISKAARENEVPLHWSQTDGDPVALITIPPVNKKKRVRIEALQLGNGELFVSGVTEKK